MRFAANLVVPTSGTYSIGFDGSEGGYFEFLTPSPPLAVPRFTRLTAESSNVSSITTSSQGNAQGRLESNYVNAYVRTVGEIALAAGTYPVRGLWMHDFGTAGFELIATSSAGQAAQYRPNQHYQW